MDNEVRAFLGRLRTEVPGCHAAALVDLDTNMVLTDDTDEPIGQEVWDALAAKSIELMLGAQALRLAAKLDGTADAIIHQVHLVHGDDLILLVRSQAEPPLGLMALCRQPFDPQLWVSAATEGLEAIATTE